ncbi:MAG TPA: hypothetical protein VFS64_09985 [Solirubrobacterales bacterium]|nr:hypothetical protein [Solirubrobacterales bacterium]
MIARRLLLPLACATTLLLGALPAAGASAAGAAPAWRLNLAAVPTAFPAGSEAEYQLTAVNLGGAPSDPSSPVSLQVSLPVGVIATSVESFTEAPNPTGPGTVPCQINGQLVQCETTVSMVPGSGLGVTILGTVTAAEGSALSASATIGGGGATQVATASATTPISSQPAPFGFTSFAAPLIDAEGNAATGAGSHPNQLTLDMQFPSVRPGVEWSASGHVRDAFGALPRGLAADPAATPVLCTEAELLRDLGSNHLPGCPASSQVGLAEITVPLPVMGGIGTERSPLYNMVPPPGTPASLGFDAAAIGIYIHLLSGVRSDSDYGLYGYSNDVLALGQHSLVGFRLQLWGDPSSASHDPIRGRCSREGGTCPWPGEAGRTPFLSAPTECPAHPDVFQASADSWEEPGLFRQASYESADSEGNPVSISGCNQLSYEPTISAQPTTNQADSPAGLEVDLRQPQQPPVAKGEDPLQGRATAELKNARVTLPAGMAVNPSQADGLAACTEEQIGYLAEDEEPGVHFSKAPQSCPDAAKLGTMEVSSPLLAEYKNEETEVVTDPETGAPIPRPLHGSVYLAEPYANPFGSLLAIYMAIEDPKSGIVAKLAGRVEPDPDTGQLTTVFEENPELPLSDIHLSLFGGARGSLITPQTCGTHTTTTDLTPWSTPEGADAHPSDSFQVTGEPGGGTCPASEAQAANSPSFEAGTITPQAGAYSPFVLKLHREDGSQRLTGIDTTLPPGLTGKLAGIAECSDAQIAQARSREAPNMGQAEKDSPSCPASSEVGVVKVAAGAGPNPFWASGHAYLAGPYKGAPLSLAVIVPAIAGPFDLGTVVSRVALYVNPETAQIHAVSDPFPTILQGIPLDLRTVVLEMGRPSFTLNPTNCAPMSVLGTATSALGNVASLSNPFQVGGCSSLAFKPHLKISLSGGTKRSGHPALKAVLTMPPGGANVARAQVGLPHALFLDQGNLNKVCTQPELRSDTCPASSVYGHARAISPLLDAPLEGPVYLGVGYGHKLPDLVADLNGQIRVLLHGKVDTTSKDGIRNTFEVVPDAPVSKFTLSLKGGKRYSLIENSESLCARPQKASVLFVAQSGKVARFASRIAVKCRGHKARKRHRKGRR